MNTLVTAIFTNGIGVVCAAAVLWFAYYRETKTIPLMMQTFDRSLQQFTETVGLMQNSFGERNKQNLDTFSAAMREERQDCERRHEENRARLDSIAAEIKENRHGIRDLANVLNLREAVERQREKQAKERGKGGGEGGL